MSEILDSSSKLTDRSSSVNTNIRDKIQESQERLYPSEAKSSNVSNLPEDLASITDSQRNYDQLSGKNLSADQKSDTLSVHTGNLTFPDELKSLSATTQNDRISNAEKRSQLSGDKRSHRGSTAPKSIEESQTDSTFSLNLDNLFGSDISTESKDKSKNKKPKGSDSDDFAALLGLSQTTIPASKSRSRSKASSTGSPETEEAEDETHDPEFRMIKDEFDPTRRFTLSTVRDFCGSLGMDSQITFEVISERPSVVDSEPEASIDRFLYESLYSFYNERKNKLQGMNRWYQHKMAAYFLRRKMFYVMQERQHSSGEARSKYYGDLDSLSELLQNSLNKKEMMEKELEDLQNLRKTKIKELNETFIKLQTIEHEFGQGLTFLKTGRQNMEKLTERYIHRQKSVLNMLMNMRVKYVKLRNRYYDTVQALEDMEKLGPGFTIMDYVELKHDNRTLVDRLENRVHEFTKHRKILNHVMQLLAHAREKSSFLDIDLTEFKNQLENAEIDLRDLREQLNSLKQERMIERAKIKKAKFHYGLLVRPKMLRDMQRTRDEVVDAKKTIEEDKKIWKDRKMKVEAIRKNLGAYIRHREKQKMLQTEASNYSIPEKGAISQNVLKPEKKEDIKQTVSVVKIKQ